MKTQFLNKENDIFRDFEKLSAEKSVFKEIIELQKGYSIELEKY